MKYRNSRISEGKHLLNKQVMESLSLLCLSSLKIRYWKRFLPIRRKPVIMYVYVTKEISVKKKKADLI